MRFRITPPGRRKIIQMSFVILSAFLTIGMPMMNYFSFKLSITQGIDIGNLEQQYDVIIIFVIPVGILISVCSYLVFNSPKTSVRKGVISLTHSILDLIFLNLFSQFAKINIVSTSDCVSCSGYSLSGIFLNFSGVFLLLIIISSLFVVKNIYDVVDYKLHENFYTTQRREQSFKKKVKKRI